MYNESSASLALKKTSGKKQTYGTENLVAHPKSIDEVIRVITNPKHFPAPVRPVGSNSAESRANRAQAGTILDMTRMNKVLSIGKDTITVQAGIRLHEIAEILAEGGQELLSGDEIPDRTLGGALSSPMLTSGHAGEPDHLSSSIVEMIVVSPSGQKVTISAEHKRYMSLFRMSYGLTGVICHVTLKTQAIRTYKISTTKLVLDELATVMPQIADIRLGIKMHIMPFRNRAWVELRRPCEDQKPIRNLPWKIKKWARSSAMPKVVNSVSKAFSVSKIRDPLIDSVTEATQKLFIGNFADYSSNAMEMSGKFATMRDPDGERVSCSWAYPAERFAAVLADFRRFSTEHYSENGFRCDLPAHAYRINENKEAMLSPSFNGPIFVLKLSSTMARGWDHFAMDFAEFSQKHEGIPLFSQTRCFTAVRASQVFGMRLRAFRNARERLDPEGRMLNQFFMEHIG